MGSNKKIRISHEGLATEEVSEELLRLEVKYYIDQLKPVVDKLIKQIKQE